MTTSASKSGCMKAIPNPQPFYPTPHLGSEYL